MKNRLEDCLLVPHDDEILFAFDGDDVTVNLYRMAVIPREDYESLTADNKRLRAVKYAAANLLDDFDNGREDVGSFGALRQALREDDDA